MQPQLIYTLAAVNQQTKKRPDKQTQSLSNFVADVQRVLKHLTVAALQKIKLSGLFYEGQTDKCGNHFLFACLFRLACPLTVLV